MYNCILIIINWFIKIVDYELNMVIINTLRPDEVICNVVI